LLSKNRSTEVEFLNIPSTILVSDKLRKRYLACLDLAKAQTSTLVWVIFSPLCIFHWPRLPVIGNAIELLIDHELGDLFDFLRGEEDYAIGSDILRVIDDPLG
jgi:hypothetical protein